MKCPFCSSEALKVTDSRDASETNAIRRRRECMNCAKRFTTFETVELLVQVKKRDGTFEEFQPAKLMNGIDAACSHTKVSRDQIIGLSTDIIDQLINGHMQELSTTVIGEMVMSHLLKIDPIAYIRFACVYRRFKDIKELEEAIQSIQSKDEIKS